MASGRVFVLAETHRHFRKWCSDNNRDHNDPKIIVVVTSDNVHRLKGRAWQEDDRVVEIGWVLPNIRSAFFGEIARMETKKEGF